MAIQTEDKIDEFRRYVLAGMTRPEIMKKMKLKWHPQFASLELKLIKLDKKIYEIPSGSSSSESNVNTVVVGKKNNITISKQILSNSSYLYNEGDTFTVQLKGPKIILTKEDTPA